MEHASLIGIDAYIEEQLHPESIVDTIEPEIAQHYPSTQLPGSQLLQVQTGEAQRALRDATLHRMLYSNRQLLEVMVDFWSNHFNIDQRVVGRHKIADDRDVIRPHAMGSFRDLLHASAKSPAMLKYLDNVSNTKQGPNENYARELLELHTMGIGGGYTEDDIKAVARCFTGWQVDRETISFKFNSSSHDDEEKYVLGHYLAAGQGVEDGEQLLEILLSHPSTARFIATKLARRFVADEPPASLVAKLAQSYELNSGDIRSMLRVILTSEEFLASPDVKMKRPQEYICSAIRAMAPEAGTYNGPDVVNTLANLGQVPFAWSAPDGYPDVASYWNSTPGLAARWEFTRRLAEDPLSTDQAQLDTLIGDAETASELVDRLTDRILHRDLTPEARTKLIAAVTEQATGSGAPLAVEVRNETARFIAAALLSSPYFMVR
jgi:uncharacterized protein (DUF1800 family)